MLLVAALACDSARDVAAQLFVVEQAVAIAVGDRAGQGAQYFFGEQAILRLFGLERHFVAARRREHDRAGATQNVVVDVAIVVEQVAARRGAAHVAELQRERTQGAACALRERL